MDHPIEAIFLDVGNTLRIVIEDKEFMARAKKDLMMLGGTKETEEAFFAKLDARGIAIANSPKRRCWRPRKKNCVLNGCCQIIRLKRFPHSPVD